MPPKGKAKKGKKSAGGEEAPSVDPKEAERLSLKGEAFKLYKLTQKEDREYNELQQQREKINYFWIVEKKILEDKKAELRNKERELQDLEEKHEVEVKIYKQRVKHLLFDHENELTEYKAEAETSMKLAQDDHRATEASIKQDKRARKVQLKEMEISHAAMVRSLKQELNNRVTLLRQEYERKAFEIQKSYEKQMKDVRERLEKRRRADVEAIEKKKDSHIEQLMKNHEKAFADIKNYYNDITHNNLDLIKSLKEDVHDMKKKEQQDEKKMSEIANENIRMSEPLAKAKQDLEKLNQELERYQVEKDDLRSVKARLLLVEDKHHCLKWESEVLSQRLDAVKMERKDLFDRFQATVFKVQQKTGFKTVILEKKLEAEHETLEHKEAELTEVLQRANLDPSLLGRVRNTTEDILDAKNQAIRDLQIQLEKVMDQYSALMVSMQQKMAEYGVPTEELGFTLMVPTPMKLRHRRQHQE